MTKPSWLFVGATVGALALALALSVLTGELTVHAVPQPPHVFFGKVFIETSLAAARRSRPG